MSIMKACPESCKHTGRALRTEVSAGAAHFERQSSQKLCPHGSTKGLRELSNSSCLRLGCIPVSLASGAYQSTLSSTTNLTHALLDAMCIVLMTSCNLGRSHCSSLFIDKHGNKTGNMTHLCFTFLAATAAPAYLSLLACAPSSFALRSADEPEPDLLPSLIGILISLSSCRGH